MGLFDKKYCDICGEKIGLLGNRKLEDGNLCKDCAKKLSPWFSDRRRSTVEDIKGQLAYREENREKAAQFRTTRSFGEDWKVLLDEEHRWFTVTRARDLAEANPDILDFDAITGCRMDIDESRTELTREDADGKDVSYVPPRYEYSYDFFLVISVRHPYFDEMRFGGCFGFALRQIDFHIVRSRHGRCYHEKQQQQEYDVGHRRHAERGFCFGAFF